MRVTRYMVSWRDDAGPHMSKIMSLAEASEQARQLRTHGAEHVQLKNASAPKPAAGYDRDWRIVS